MPEPPPTASGDVGWWWALGGSGYIAGGVVFGLETRVGGPIREKIGFGFPPNLSDCRDAFLI